jgi:L-ascorbate metabolism protein UlaG (beta-lactamase superfamily)
LPKIGEGNHFDGRRFYNPGGAQARGLADVLRWKLTTRGKPWPRWIDDVVPSKPPETAAAGELRVTLINHSTLLIQTAGVNLLTDPIWSQRVSPVSFAGPKRRRAPGVKFEDLPRIHAVLLSHNHYDHLDLPTVRRLHRRDRPRFVVPLGLQALLRANGIEAFEMDWWQKTEAAGVPLQSLPAQHFSARAANDRNRTLWCGYGLETSVGPVYFAGDTGMGGHFAEIRCRFGTPRLALLPIGAYLPGWFMKPIHISPTEAIAVHRLLGASVSVAIHHGTFPLADDGPDDPANELRALAPRTFGFWRMASL